MTPSGPAGPDLLGAIVAATRRVVAVRGRQTPIAELAARAERVTPRPGRFASAVGRPDRVNVIAECKRRSPSRGVLREEYDPASIARGYAAAGAAAVSVLTEPTFFDGAIEHLEAVRTATDLPLLRKDFVVSDYQVLEARAAGADAVLLIVAALDRAELASLMRVTAAAGLDALVEVHDEREVDDALEAGARLIGVNNRNLRTLDVDVRASEAVLARLPREVTAVSESGLRTRADIDRLRGLGYRACLIGERLMTAPDPGAALADLLK